MMQRFTDYEVWIIDGASTDGTQEYLKTLGSRFNYISEKDFGIYNAMNKGIEKSTGEWLYFLGADDKFFDSYVLDSLSKFFLIDSLDLIFGRVLYEFDGDYPFIYSKKKKVKEPSWNLTIWLRNPVHHQGTFFRRRLFESLNYDSRFDILADYHLNLKLYKEKVSVIIYDEFIAKCLSSGVSKKGFWKMYKEEAILKTELSRKILFVLFYGLSFLKYILAWNIRGKK